MSHSPLDDFLKFHKRSCTFYIFSGERRCSCGRDAALAELKALRNEVLVCDRSSLANKIYNERIDYEIR
jgi:hypothetical protein